MAVPRDIPSPLVVGTTSAPGGGSRQAPAGRCSSCVVFHSLATMAGSGTAAASPQASRQLPRSAQPCSLFLPCSSLVAAPPVPFLSTPAPCSRLLWWSVAMPSRTSSSPVGKPFQGSGPAAAGPGSTRCVAGLQGGWCGTGCSHCGRRLRPGCRYGPFCPSGAGRPGARGMGTGLSGSALRCAIPGPWYGRVDPEALPPRRARTTAPSGRRIRGTSAFPGALTSERS